MPGGVAVADAVGVGEEVAEGRTMGDVAGVAAGRAVGVATVREAQVGGGRGATVVPSIRTVGVGSSCGEPQAMDSPTATAVRPNVQARKVGPSARARASAPGRRCVDSARATFWRT